MIWKPSERGLHKFLAPDVTQKTWAIYAMQIVSEVHSFMVLEIIISHTGEMPVTKNFVWS